MMSDGLSDIVIDSVVRAIRLGRSGDLVIDDLRADDLERISWSGSPTHVRSVGQALESVLRGGGEYVVVRAPGGVPVAKLGIDYCAYPDAGMLWQMATASQLQGLGLGTRLIAEAEERIRRRGLRWAVLGVEDNNPRARALYERLGYQDWQRVLSSWQQEDSKGNVSLYRTELKLLRKKLR